MRISSFARASATLVALIGFLACSATTTSTDGSSGGQPAEPDAPTTLPDDIGKSCNAGCDADMKVCVVTQTPSCTSGDCIVDSRAGFANLDAYCSGDCRVASCPSGFTCADATDALTNASLRRCLKDPTSSKPDAGPDAAKKDAGPTAAFAACKLTLDGCGSVCGDLGKSCASGCSGLGSGVVGQTFASESSCNAGTGAVDDLTSCGGGSVADWTRCCCQ